MLTLAEELLLLALHDEKGTVLTSASVSLPYGLAGAILMELALNDRLAIRSDALSVTSSSRTGNPLFDEALGRVAQESRTRNAQYWVNKIAGATKDLKQRVLDGLLEKGILRREEHRILWVFHASRYPEQDAQPEHQVRDRIRAVVLDSAPLDARTGALISLMHACGLDSQVFVRDERKLAKQRIKAMVVEEAIGGAIASTVAGIMAAITASSAATTVIVTAST